MHQLRFQVGLNRRTMNRTDFKANVGFSNKIGFRTTIFSGFDSVYSELPGPIGFQIRNQSDKLKVRPESVRI